MNAKAEQRGVILVTGATGYIGGLLVPRLLNNGLRVRCLARNPAGLAARPWRDEVEVAAGDVLDPGGLSEAMRGVEVAFYLVHSLGGGSDFHERDLAAAKNFGNAARDAGVPRIVYLGGLASDTAELSEHLRSRQQTGDALRQSGVPVTEFRAGVIVGPGSVSFEMIRYLTERVPVMICPRWVYTRTQPVGINEVLEYLTASIGVPESSGRIIEIGGSEVVTYGAMMTTYAEARGLKRLMIAVPVLTPRLSSYWVNLVTPIPGVIARPLIEGLRNENIVRDRSALRLFPGIQPVSYRASVERALAGLRVIDGEFAPDERTGPAGIADTAVVSLQRQGMIIEHRRLSVPVPPERVYAEITGLGGKRGWFYMDWAWKVRGFVDRLIGGVGLRRGRRDPHDLRVGDTLDFWRVEAAEPGRMLRLRAEMKLPGEAWLEFRVSPGDGRGATLHQTAFFAPKGLMGVLYWYLLYPFHHLIFGGLIERIGRRAASGKEG